MVEAAYWKSVKFIPKKCGKAHITFLNYHRCEKLTFGFFETKT